MEDQEDGTTVNQKRIGIVGGGSGGNELLRIFSRSETLSIVFLVDANPSAPAMQAAQRMGIRTMANVDQALRSEQVDYVIDATGSPDSLSHLQSKAPRGTEVVTSGIALMLFNVLDESRRQVNQEVFNDISEIKHSIVQNTANVYKTLKGIKKVSADLEMLAVNAGIQAARANEFGKGFAVVAGEVKNTARTANNLAQSIEQINEEISSMSDKIESSLKKLN